MNGYEAIRQRTEEVDRLLAALFESSSSKSGLALVSQGGYGRRELCLHSDIDLLFLCEKRVDPSLGELTQKILHPLWDLGYEVGFAVRTLRDCRRLMEEDVTVLSSLVDARLVAGDPRLFGELFDLIHRHFSSEKKRNAFFELKRKEDEERESRYGGSVYLLEPHIKEGRGGLRDYHTLYWFARILHTIDDPRDLSRLLARSEFEGLWKSVNLLWQVRNELHVLAGRKQDQLLLDCQEPIAKTLGFESNDQMLGVERFMQEYYQSAARIREVSRKWVRSMRGAQAQLFSSPPTLLADGELRVVDGRLSITRPDLFEQEPMFLLRIFQVAQGSALEIDDSAREKIEASLPRVAELRENPAAGALFREMLKSPVGLGSILGQMNDCGILGAFLPEFEKLRFRVQHDIYHVYTVDQHSIFAVAELGKLVQGDYAESHKTFTGIVRSVDRIDLLAFGILYHDIGKGEGKGHVEKGAPLIREAGRRLGFSPNDLDALEFLERSHLIMSHLAFRRDFDDPNLILRFARSVQNLPNLDRLCLLTFCDIKAVGPDAMTSWKATLLELLTLKTREVLLEGAERDEGATSGGVASGINRVRDSVQRELKSDEDRRIAGLFLDSLPSRYLLATAPERIAYHLNLWRRLEREGVVLDERLLERERLSEVTLLTTDSPGLFSRMTGIFAAHNINILSAELTVSREGIAIQSFRVTDHQGEPIRDPEKWERCTKNLNEVLSGRERIEALVAEKFRPSLFRKKTAGRLPSKIEVDNEVSAYYTVIDIYAHDRMGLLYQITATMAALGLYVEVSKISTKVDQVSDTFYVKDIFGQKLTDEGRVKKIRERLLAVVDSEPTPDWRVEA